MIPKFIITSLIRKVVKGSVKVIFVFNMSAVVAFGISVGIEMGEVFLK